MIDAVPTDPAARMIARNQTSRGEAEKVAKQFEAIFVQQIVSKMREGADLMGQGSMFGSGPGSDTYATWFDSHMSEHLAKSGRVGVADALMKHFEDLGQVEPAASKLEKGNAKDLAPTGRRLDRVV